MKGLINLGEFSGAPRLFQPPPWLIWFWGFFHSPRLFQPLPLLLGTKEYLWHSRFQSYATADWKISLYIRLHRKIIPENSAFLILKVL